MIFFYLKVSFMEKGRALKPPWLDKKRHDQQKFKSLELFQMIVNLSDPLYKDRDVSTEWGQTTMTFSAMEPIYTEKCATAIQEFHKDNPEFTSCLLYHDDAGNLHRTTHSASEKGGDEC